MDSSFYYEFITIVESKNFAEAADKLASSTSALSRHLKSAEEELGVELFTRTSRGVTLNEYGELFLQYAKKMYSQHEDFMTQIKKKVEYRKNTLYYSGNYQFNLFLAPFKKKYPQYHIKQVYAPPGKFSIECLISRECEISINISTRKTMDDEYVVSKKVGTDTLIVAISSDHPLAKKTSVRMSELRDQQFITILSRETHLPMNMDIFERANFEPNIAFSCATGEEALVLISQGYGAAIMMRDLAEQSASASVSLLDIEGEDTYSIFMCRRRGEKLSPAAEALWDYADTAKWRK